jgi:ATP-binding cassette subfamily B protein
LKHLSAVYKYFWKYRFRFIAGIFLTATSNYFAVMVPEITGYIVGKVQEILPGGKPMVLRNEYDGLVTTFIHWVNSMPFAKLVTVCCATILLLAILRGLFMFFMRQTIIVMSRHIEFDQKNEVYQHYQRLDAGFYKTHSTGDLMNRMAEDVSRVRMFTGPAIMYLINLLSLITLSVMNMFRKDVHLSLIVLAPLPVLALTIYIVNTVIHRKSERVQALLSDLTTNAQESYSGIRVIKSFVQEKAMLGFFSKNSEDYRKNAVGLAKVEAVYFPSMTLLVGLSTLITILVGGQMALADPVNKVGLIVEFVIYINMLTFPVSAIGSVASMIQRASASQKRLNEFLQTEPAVQDKAKAAPAVLKGDIVFNNVSYTYANTGIKAVQQFSLTIAEGQKVLIMGKTGSGKSTLAQLLLRFYDADEGTITIGGTPISNLQVRQLREQISYVPQDVFLFSDTVGNNISFGLPERATAEKLQLAARLASVDTEIKGLEKEYETMVGERGITLSGGQKQRVSIARALIKDARVLLFDDCLSAVDAKTENTIVHNLYEYLDHKTAIIITHRIFTALHFDQVVIVEDGKILEKGTHEQLLALNGYYAELYRLQVSNEQSGG